MPVIKVLSLSQENNKYIAGLHCRNQFLCMVSFVWLQSVGWENMAFVFLNRYLDLSEVCMCRCVCDTAFIDGDEF